MVSDRVQANVDQARNAFRFTYENSATCADVAGTAWGLVQASTEYLDHARAFRSRDTYLGRSILGVDQSKRKAIGIVGDLFGDQLARLDTDWAHRIVGIGEELHQQDARARCRRGRSPSEQWCPVVDRSRGRAPHRSPTEDGAAQPPALAQLAGSTPAAGTLRHSNQDQGRIR